MIGFSTFVEGIMADDQASIEQRVMAVIAAEKSSPSNHYHCAYCHNGMKEGEERCKYCGASKKVRS